MEPERQKGPDLVLPLSVRTRLSPSSQNSGAVGTGELILSFVYSLDFLKIVIIRNRRGGKREYN